MERLLPLIWVVDQIDKDAIFMQQAMTRIENPCQLLIFPDCLSILEHVSSLHRPPQFIVIDYQLDGMNGYELTQTLRLIPFLKRIPIGWLGDDMVMPTPRELEELGVKWCWPKPANYPGWQNLIEEFCQKAADTM
ncbi:response regulator [Arsenicibacter rosenii]|uniref:response regulator n=1 Tax=Arsenicibacter rosenii TaxID=1750698 RepID=UPI0008F88BAE|nr:response regulator [Arsenicibacter rosenii]